ncbi:aureocin A53 family class IId bacteriocin [Aeribacillus sp. FSL K6-1121]|jgi:hypothetical protein|uniref:aureocin A53 family class IId bacteriocin n=1 Tax=Aeribacillus sp. FSL K6-1121 TaxID=2954745 RepID=UPI002870C4FD|nr:aureocin A53 family class IId bacteriocin [Aeribacillus pallidus]
MWVTRAWQVISKLSGKAYEWAKNNISKIIEWLKNGATFEWISDKIDQIIN